MIKVMISKLGFKCDRSNGGIQRKMCELFNAYYLAIYLNGFKIGYDEQPYDGIHQTLYLGFIGIYRWRPWNEQDCNP